MKRECRNRKNDIVKDDLKYTMYLILTCNFEVQKALYIFFYFIKSSFRN